MNQERYFTALILIAGTQRIIKERRKTEMMCGYPEEYGGDEILLKRIDTFMADTHIQHDLQDAVDMASIVLKKPT
jgi:hypothetical protein